MKDFTLNALPATTKVSEDPLTDLLRTGARDLIK